MEAQPPSDRLLMSTRARGPSTQTPPLRCAIVSENTMEQSCPSPDPTCPGLFRWRLRMDGRLHEGLAVCPSVRLCPGCSSQQKSKAAYANERLSPTHARCVCTAAASRLFLKASPSSSPAPPVWPGWLPRFSQEGTLLFITNVKVNM